MTACRMLHHVVDGLLEDEEHVAAHVCDHGDVVVGSRCAKPEGNLACGTDIADEVPHALRQIAEMILVGVNRPHDVAHRVYELS